MHATLSRLQIAHILLANMRRLKPNLPLLQARSSFKWVEDTRLAVRADRRDKVCRRPIAEHPSLMELRSYQVQRILSGCISRWPPQISSTGHTSTLCFPLGRHQNRLNIAPLLFSPSPLPYHTLPPPSPPLPRAYCCCDI